MISATNILMNGDGTAWVIPKKCPDPSAPQPAHWGQGNPCEHGYRILNRTCGFCGGDPIDMQTGSECHGCDGTGRHTFDIDIEGFCMQGGTHELVNGACHFCGSAGKETLRVSVVEVTELTTENLAVWSARYLPESAAVGKWAVRLKVTT